MGFRIQNNIVALNAHRNLMTSSTGLSKALQRLSSGYRINSAADDAAGLAISQGFRADIAAVKVAQRNISEANAFLQVAEGGMSTIGDILTRMKELATQAASANVGSADRSKLSGEYDKLVAEIDRIANSTKYSGTALLTGYSGVNTTSDADLTGQANIYDIDVSTAAAGDYTFAYVAATNALTVSKGGVSQTVTLADNAQTVNLSTHGISFKTTAAFAADTFGAAVDTKVVTVDAAAGGSFQIGYKNVAANDRLAVTVSSVTAASLSVAANDIGTQSGAQTTIATIDTAISTLATARGTIGAYQNRLTYASANLSVTLENFTAAESVIRDVDMAAEMTTFTKNQILVQAGTAMLAQANMAPQLVLSLFGQ